MQDFIKSTDHRPIDHRPTDHQPLTDQPQTNRPTVTIMILKRLEYSIYSIYYSSSNILSWKTHGNFY